MIGFIEPRASHCLPSCPQAIACIQAPSLSIAAFLAKARLVVRLVLQSPELLITSRLALGDCIYAGPGPLNRRFFARARLVLRYILQSPELLIASLVAFGRLHTGLEPLNCCLLFKTSLRVTIGSVVSHAPHKCLKVLPRFCSWPCPFARLFGRRLVCCCFGCCCCCCFGCCCCCCCCCGGGGCCCCCCCRRLWPYCCFGCSLCFCCCLLPFLAAPCLLQRPSHHLAWLGCTPGSLPWLHRTYCSHWSRLSRLFAAEFLSSCWLLGQCPGEPHLPRFATLPLAMAGSLHLLP